ncbi:DUF4956 domain-containing protein [Butyrivibrio sp. CB08]|uniref:DUF4956 domain-containing protein n=1 Tax=Butyrivibrio sp. CB08 TaxID=2364879 RepID=UPI000EA9D6B3|nr:DUF4956 domain-containing protein [Butyrivibrio sp. CB08]RKM61407.1 DUF4956 domain-containing protein [Butyrivibrio sp. CB08]
MTTDIIFDSILTTGTMTGTAFLTATFCSLIIGCFIAFMYTLKNNYSKSYIITLALLPAIVQVIIMMVNGSIGAGIAVAGTFSLVRFRSAPGSGKEITSIFLAMAAGLATGMGYIGIAVIFTLIITLANHILSGMSFKGVRNEEKTLKITVPESLDFEGIFDDIFARYTDRAELEEVKTTGMGSLYKLTYKISLKSKASAKGMIDEMRQRNGNLEITCSRPVMVRAEEL